jgi:HAD superfamily hydrolase (TIGR01509 family)
MAVRHAGSAKPHAARTNVREDVGVAGKRQAVVFDNDGLLLDTEAAWTRAEHALFARLGAKFTMEHKRTLIGSSRTDAAVKLEAILERPGAGERLMDELHELVMEEALAGVAPRPGALKLLARLTAAGIPLAVASNSERAFLERTLTSAGLLPDGPFRTTVAAGDVERPKPAPDIYLEACRRLGADPAECVALEDSPIGAAAAAAAGMFVIGVPYFAGEQVPGSDLLVDSLADPAVEHAVGLKDAAAQA